MFRTDQGGLAAPVSATIFEGRAARTHARGDGLAYSTGPEHRDAGELERIAEQLPGTKVYIPHPRTFPASQSGAPAVGHVLSARVDGDHVVAQIAVTDPATVRAIKSGTRELSLGYTCDLDGDRFQRNTRIDHLAIVERARCGASCSMRADCGCRGNNDMITKKNASPGMVCDCAPNMDAPLELGSSCPNCGGYVQATFGDPMGVSATDVLVKTGLTATTPMPTSPPGPALNPAAVNVDGKLTAAARSDIPTPEFAVPETKQLPIEDADHVRAAMDRFGETHFSDHGTERAAYHRILAKAHSLGIDPTGFAARWGSRMDQDLHAAIPVPQSSAHVTGVQEPTVNLDQALAALAAANEKLGAQAAQSQAAITAADKARSDADKARSDAEGKLTAAEVARDLAQSQVATLTTAAEKARTDAASAAETAQARFDADVAERVALLAAASQILGSVDKDKKPVDRSKTDARALKVEIVKHVDGIDIAADKVPAYVDGMYAGALERHAKAAGSVAGTRQAIVGLRVDAAKNPALQSHRDQERAAAAAAKKRLDNAWMQGNDDADGAEEQE